MQTVGPAERILIKALLTTMYENKGVGLAAPQIGVNQQIFVADVGQGPIAVINPKIVKKTGSKKMEEGCLSIPGVVVKVRRPEKIMVSYLDENNQEVEFEFSDLLARVFQHETDHLFGRLIIDYASLVQKGKMRKQLNEIKKLGAG